MSLTGGQVDAQNHIGGKARSGESSSACASLVGGTAVVIGVGHDLGCRFEVNQRERTVEFALNINKLRI